ncbi:MAG: hypothetical protein MJB14_03190 [Spirochaetes bacterium]|nr:hypothetical protein [Spirochaetota bacterium]
MIDDGKFREDLYFRINEFSVFIPALRDRKEDIPLLVKRFVKEISEHLHIVPKKINKECMDFLCKYQWSGNVRELKNTLKKAIVVSETATLLPDHFDFFHNDNATEKKLFVQESEMVSNPELDMDNLESFNFKQYVKEYKSQVEKDIIKKALNKFKGNKSKVARFLKLDYKTLFNKINEFSLNSGEK